MVSKYFGNSKKALVSPSLDARRAGTGATPQQSDSNLKNIAATDNGVSLVIAVQNGVGTAKGAVHFDAEKNSKVNKYNHPVTGSGTWPDLYHAPTSDYFSGFKKAVNGTGATLWGNLEAMSASRGFIEPVR